VYDWRFRGGHLRPMGKCQCYLGAENSVLEGSKFSDRDLRQLTCSLGSASVTYRLSLQEKNVAIESEVGTRVF
jgi:hypothetical protein